MIRARRGEVTYEMKGWRGSVFRFLDEMMTEGSRRGDVDRAGKT